MTKETIDNPYQMTTLMECGNPVDAGIYCGLLEDQNIFHQKNNFHSNSVFQGMGLVNIIIRVKAQDLVQAKEVISPFISLEESGLDHEEKDEESKISSEENYRSSIDFKLFTLFKWVILGIFLLYAILSIVANTQ